MKTFSLKYPLLFLLAIVLFTNISFSQPSYWQKLFFQPSLYDITGTGICSADGNNYLVLSDSQLPEGTILYKINQYGDTIFAKYISGVRGLCGITDNNGGMFISGLASNHYPLRSFLMRVNSNCQIVFNNSYPNSEPSTCYDVIKSIDGSIILCGRFSNSGYMLKVKSDGQFVWQRLFPASDYYYIYSVTDAVDGGYLIAADVKDSLSAPYFASGAVSKIDTAGNKLWEHRYFSPDSSQYFRFIKLGKHNEGYILGGRHLDNTGYRSIFELMKIDKNGNIKYRLPYDISQRYSYYLMDMKVLSKNRIIVLYQKYNLPNQDSLFSGAIITDTLGQIVSSNEYMTLANYTSLYKIIDNPIPTKILFTGTTDFNSVYERVLVIKTDSTLYTPPVSVRNISQIVPDNFYLKQNYPNPFNSATQIVFGIKKKGLYNLKIYDVTGKLINEIFNQSFEPGEYKTDFHADNLSSGVYFYNLESNNSIITKKFVLLK
jgi:hypothetical protein